MSSKKIEAVFRKNAGITQPAIEKLLGLNVGKKYQEIVQYQVSTGGKRIRPTLAIISSQLLGGKINDVLYPAAGLEILHNYTLIVDDIIDNSYLRRRKPTVWAKFGKSIAQCIAVDYGVSIFEAAHHSKTPGRISEIFAKSIKVLVDGEILDILFEQGGRKEDPYVVKNRYRRITERDYIEMVSKKTATLFQSCCEVGGICAGATAKEMAALKNYGFNLGIAFQISDDILDIFGEEKKFGKQIGKDIEERKMGNIIVCFALQELPPKEGKTFRWILAKNKISKDDLRKAMSFIQKTKAKERALAYGKKFVKKAKANLAFLPKNKYNYILEAIADLVMERKK